jgi:hypothetical protein
MYKSNLSIALFCAVALAPFALYAQQAATTPVTIRVSDQTGAVIAHAQIKLAPSSEQSLAKLETDDHGQLALNLKAGAMLCQFLPRDSRPGLNVSLSVRLRSVRLKSARLR